MNIRDIISRHYSELHKIIPFPYISLYDGVTYEDILHNVTITAINKYKNKDIDENEGFEYLRKTLLMEIKFTKNRKKNDMISLVENAAPLNDEINSDYGIN